MARFITFCLFLLVAWPASAATWVSGTVASIERYGDGQLLIVVVWTDDQGAQDKTSMVVSAASAMTLIQAELTKRNALDSAILTDLKVGTVIGPASVVVTPPTQEEIDGAAFIVLVRAWLVEIGKLSAGVGSQSDVDAAKLAIAPVYAGAKSQSTKARYDATLLAASRSGLF